MSAASLREVARRLWDDLRSAGSSGVPSTLVHADYLRHEPNGDVTITGLAGFEKMIAGAHAALPDVTFTLHDQIAEGDLVATRWTATATQTSTWRGVAPTGRVFTFNGITISRFDDGKVVEEWMQWDGADAVARLRADGEPS